MSEPTKRSINDLPEMGVEIRVYPHSAGIEGVALESGTTADLIVVQVGATANECEISIRVPMPDEEKEILKIYGLHPSDLRALAHALITAAETGERN